MPYLSSTQLRNLRGAPVVILLYSGLRGIFIGSCFLLLAVCLPTDGKLHDGRQKTIVPYENVNVAAIAS